MDFLYSLLAFIITLSVLIAVHEYGHFKVARLMGVQVLRFSIGFGSPLFSWKDKNGTEFVIAGIPLGGYVRMLDEREASVPENLLPYAFNRKPVIQRIAIVAAGPLINLAFAVAVYWVLFVVGVTHLIPVIGEVQAESPAALAELETGQEIIAIDGKEVQSWEDITLALVSRIGDNGEIKFGVRHPESSFEEEKSVKVEGWMIGKDTEDPLNLLGIVPSRPKLEAVVGEALEGKPARLAGIKKMDRIISIEDQQISYWTEVVETLQNKSGMQVRILVERNGLMKAFELVPESVALEDGSKIGRIGIAPYVPEGFGEDQRRVIRHSPLSAMKPALNETWQRSVLTLHSIWKMLKGIIAVETLSGPITIAKLAGTTASYGLETFLGFLAYLSITLGILNLLPIPVLDGGHLMYYVVELITGRPIPENIQILGIKIGMALLFTIMALAIYNDILRL